MYSLSIIIPIYNVERYIYDTFESIYSQKEDETAFEVIAVNDGTQDNSMTLVEKFAKVHGNLHIINQKNQGLSCARNAGLKVAQGEYIWFVDSDDTIAPGSINCLLQIIQSEKEEVYAFGSNNIIENTLLTTSQSAFTNKRFYKYQNQVHDGFFYRRKLALGIVQRFLFNRQFIIENRLTFMPHIYHEDMEYMTRVYLYAKRIKPLNERLYNYTVRSNGSITSTFNIKRFEDRLKIIRSLQKMEKLHSNNAKEAALLNDATFDLLYGLLYDTRYGDVKEYQDFIHPIRFYLLSDLQKAFWNSIILYFSLRKIYQYVMAIVRK